MKTIHTALSISGAASRLATLFVQACAEQRVDPVVGFTNTGEAAVRFVARDTRIECEIVSAEDAEKVKAQFDADKATSESAAWAALENELVRRMHEAEARGELVIESTVTAKVINAHSRRPVRVINVSYAPDVVVNGPSLAYNSDIHDDGLRTVTVFGLEDGRFLVQEIMVTDPYKPTMHTVEMVKDRKALTAVTRGVPQQVRLLSEIDRELGRHAEKPAKRSADPGLLRSA